MAVIETTMKNDPGVHEDQEGNRTQSEKTNSRNENEEEKRCFGSSEAEDEEESSSLLRNGHDSASSNDLILLDLDEKLEKKQIVSWHEWYWPEEYFEERYQRPLNFFSGLSPTAKDDSALEQYGRDDWSSGLSFARLSEEQQTRRIDKKKPLKPCLKPSSYSRTRSPKQAPRAAVQKRFSMEQVCLQNARPAMRRCSYSRLPPLSISKDGGTLDENVEEPPASYSTLFENASRATVPLTYQSLGELPPVLPQRRSTIVYDKFKAKSFNHLMLEEEDTQEETKLEKEEQYEDRHIQFFKTIQVVHIPSASEYPGDIWTALWGSRRYEERRRRLRRKRRERQLERQVDDDDEADGDDKSMLLARKSHLSQQERRRSSDITCAPEDLGIDYDEEDDEDEDDYEEWEDDTGDRHDDGEGCVVYISKEVLDRLDAANRPKIEPVAVSV